MATQESLRELLRRSDITSRARYHASKRLDNLGWKSQWTLALLAIGQIVISLISALKLPMKFSQTYVDFMGLFFGVLVLAYSLLLGMANFNARSIKLHHCGMELGRLAKELRLISMLPNVEQTTYELLVARYYQILEKYENHSSIDYLQAHYEYYSAALKTDPDNHKIPSKINLFNNRVFFYWAYFYSIFHYVFSIGIMYVWIFFLIR